MDWRGRIEGRGLQRKLELRTMVSRTRRLTNAAKIGLLGFALAFAAGYVGSMDQHGFLAFPPWLNGLFAGILFFLPSSVLGALFWTAPEDRERRISAMLNRK